MPTRHHSQTIVGLFSLGSNTHLVSLTSCWLSIDRLAKITQNTICHHLSSKQVHFVASRHFRPNIGRQTHWLNFFFVCFVFCLFFFFLFKRRESSCYWMCVRLMLFGSEHERWPRTFHFLWSHSDEKSVISTEWPHVSHRLFVYRPGVDKSGGYSWLVCLQARGWQIGRVQLVCLFTGPGSADSCVRWSPQCVTIPFSPPRVGLHQLIFTSVGMSSFRHSLCPSRFLSCFCICASSIIIRGSIRPPRKVFIQALSALVSTICRLWLIWRFLIF